MTATELVRKAWNEVKGTNKLADIPSAVFDMGGGPLGQIRCEWRKRDHAIQTTIYTRHRDEVRAVRRNDLRWARRIDAERSQP